MELFVLNNNNCNLLTVCKQIISNSFRNEITYKVLTYKSYVYPFNCVQTNDQC